MIKKGLIVLGIIMTMWGAKSAFACAGNGCTAPSPTPTEMPCPTAAPCPTETPYPTATLIPTATLYPTETPYPTLTPYPTITPLPTGAPETGPEDITGVPILVTVGGIGIILRKIAAKIW